MFQQSAILTLLGMAVVFAFLCLLIICVELVGRLVHKLGSDKDVQPVKKEQPQNADGAVSHQVTAAITTAVIEYRKKEQDYE
jgi:oxaloacetate decarboxylase gamma subunit